MKLPSHMKMIPPPRIETPTSPPQAKITTPMTQLINNGGTLQAQTTVNDDTILPPPPPSTQTAAAVSAGSHAVSKIANEMSMHIANSISSNNPITDDSDDLPPPPPPPAITDESNYAVTEL